jgi:hypothetical protein
MSVDITEPALDETDPGSQTRNGTPIPEWHYSRVIRGLRL